MSNKVFVHYPPCVSKKLEREFDTLVRTHQMLCCYGEKVEIYSSYHSLAQVRAMEPLQKNNSLGAYLVYAALFTATRLALPPSPARLKKRALFKEDRLKLRYHFRELDLCTTGIFVPHRNGQWPYDMWRNARRLLWQRKRVWLITGNEQSGWKILPLEKTPDRKIRLNRKETIHAVGAYAEPFGTRKHPLIELCEQIFGVKED